MIFLKTLRLMDFQSYEDEEIEFEDGRNVIHGLNGAGKTTILKAILYALLGRVQRLGKTVHKKDLVRKGKNSFTVEMEFEIDGEEYTVKRTNYVSGREATAKLWRGEELISEKQQNVTREITDLLGIEITTFENVIYIGQGEIPQIATQTPQKRKEIFDKFLNLDVYETVHKKFREPASRNRNKIETLGSRIGELKGDTKSLPEEEKKLVSYVDRLENKKKEQVKVDKKFDDIKKEFASEEKKKEEIDRLENSQGEKSKQIKGIYSLITKKQGEIEGILSKKISIEAPELQSILDSHKKIKESSEKKSKELDEFIKTQESTGNDLKSVRKTIEVYIINQKKSRDSIETDKKGIITDLPELKRLDISLWNSSIASKLDIANKKIEKLTESRDEATKKETERTKLDAEFQMKEKIIKENTTELKREIKKIKGFDAEWEKSLKTYSGIDFENVLTVQKDIINKIDEDNKSLMNQLAVSKSKLAEKKNELDQIESLKEGVKCPQCKQKVTDEHKTKIIEEMRVQIKEINTEIKATNDNCMGTENKLEDVKKKKKALEKDFNAYQKIKPLSENVRKLKEQLNADKKEKNAIKAKLDKILVDKTPEKYNIEISSENEKKQVFSGAAAKIDNIKKTQTSLKDDTLKLEELTKKEGKLKEQYKQDLLKEAKEESKQLETTLKNENTLLPALSNVLERVNEKDGITKEVDKIKTELLDKKKKFDSKKYEELKIKKDDINREIGAIEEEIKNLIKDLIPNTKDIIKKMKEKLDELKEKEVNLLKETKKSILINTIREFCREITPLLRQQKTTQISAKASDIFLDLVGTSGEFDGISITENYDLYVSRYGMDEDITILSGGEQVISCLAIRLAISEILANQGLILLDEPTSHLDESHVKDLVEVFEIYTPARQLITVTHDDEFEKIADLLIQVYKTKGVSQIM